MADNTLARKMDSLFEMILSVSNKDDVIYLTDLSSGYTIVSDNINRYGISETKGYRFRKAWEELIAPSDKLRVISNLEELFQSNRKNHCLEYYVRCKNCNYEKVICSGKKININDNIYFVGKISHVKSKFKKKYVNFLERNPLVQAFHEEEQNNFNGFYLKYQPIIGNLSGKIEALEVLLRWNSKTLGELSPSEFIPDLQEYHLLQKLTKKIIETALLETSELIKKYDIQINVNVILDDITDKSFIEFILQVIQKYEIHPSKICLEITERNSVNDLPEIREQIEFIRKNGVKIALDDFGAGSNTLLMLANNQIDNLKIDLSLTRKVLSSEKIKNIIQSIISLSNLHDINVTVEGVENKQQLQKLNSLGTIQTFQGFYFSCPLSAYEITQMVLSEPIFYTKKSSCKISDEDISILFYRILLNNFQSSYCIDIENGTCKILNQQAYLKKEYAQMEMNYYTFAKHYVENGVLESDRKNLLFITSREGLKKHVLEIDKNKVHHIIFTDISIGYSRYVDMATCYGENRNILFLTFTDIDQEYREQLELVRKAENYYIDSLTGCLNRFALKLHLKNEYNPRHSIIVMMADLNGLKKINDTGGHSKGDLYIKNAALLMIDIFGAKSVYRIGGDEFLVVKDDVEYEEFKEKIKKLHSLATERNISISTGYVCSNDASISLIR